MKAKYIIRLQEESPDQTLFRHEQHQHREALARERKQAYKRLSPRVGKRNTEIFGHKLDAPISPIPNKLNK